MENNQGPLQGAMIWGRALFAGLVTILSVLALFPSGQLSLEIDSSPSALGQSEADDGQDLLIVAGFSDSPIREETLGRIAKLEKALASMDGVLKLRSVASVSMPFAVDGDIQVRTLLERLAGSPDAAEREAWIQRTLTDPQVKGRLVSHDLRAAAIQMEISGDVPTRLRVARDIERIAQEHSQADWAWQVTGAPLLTGVIGDLIMRQMSVVLPLAIIIFSSIILIAFRRPLVVLAVLATVATSLLWTLAFAAAMHWPLNLVTIVIPPLVMTLAVSYCMHVVSAHADHGNLSAGLRSIRAALAFSAVTTAVGLAALGFNDLKSVQQFAMLGTVATLACALAAWTLLPLLLNCVQRPPELWPPLHSALIRGADKIVDIVVTHNQRVILGGIVILLICLIGAAKVQPGARYVGDLPADEPARVAFERVSNTFGGANRFHIDIEGSGPDAMLTNEVLRATDELQSWLLSQPEVGGAQSAVDFIKKLNQIFGSGAAEDYRLPSDAVLTKQLIYFAAPDEIYDYTDRAFSRMRIVLSTGETDTPVLRALLDRVQSRLDDLPPGLAASIGGESVELTEVIENLTGGQLESLGAAALVIFILLAFMFASAKVGLMAMLPNALPVVAYFALLGFTGTPLSPTTALVACIVLGIAVDDTLHLLVRFSQLAREMADEEQASRAAVSEVLRPITLTTVATALGFLTLVGSPFQSQMMFGLLAAATLLLAWISDLLLAPAVSSRSSIVTLWDHVRLDLGGQPHKTIPLMQDMTERQARLLALNGSVRSIRAGEHLLVQGDQGKDMFVVLDGEFRVYNTNSSGVALELATLRRGATIGEVGHFARARMASVAATENSRVLVLDESILERLRRKHSAVAALVYRNLNHIQAERMVRGA